MSGRGPAPLATNTDASWVGGRRKYDLVKEVTVSGAIVAVIVIVLAVTFGSPDPPAATMQEWATEAPQDFVLTTLSEIDGTSLAATYGPPYQTTAQDGSTQFLLFPWLSPETWFGERIPIDTFQDMVAEPLSTAPDPDAAVGKALDAWTAASADEQTAWSKAYTEAAGKATFAGGAYDVPAGDYGPLGTIIAAQYAYAMAGGLDAALLQADPLVWYSNDQTVPLLYFGDSGQGGGASGCISAGDAVPEPDTCWWYNQAVANTAPRFGGYLDGGTWGVINEVGNWPGAWWLFPYSFWYQWGPGATSGNADIYAMAMTALITVPFLFLPWIPGLRSIPRTSRLYRLMWGDYYRLVERQQADAPPGPGGG
jgi:hypothetical protein